MLQRTFDLVAMSPGHPEVWNTAQALAEDTTAPMNDRLVALAKMNEMVGPDDAGVFPPCTPEALEEHLALTADAA